jgi:hypothetical protein
MVEKRDFIDRIELARALSERSRHIAFLASQAGVLGLQPLAQELADTGA